MLKDTPTEKSTAAGALGQCLRTMDIETHGKGFFEFTGSLARWLHDEAVEDGLLTLFIRHTSASITIQENADPTVQQDLAETLERLAPQSAHYRHSSEGPDDMPSHIKSMLTSTHLAIPVIGGRMALGTWQGVFVIEHRARPHRRQVALHYLGSFKR